MAFGIYMDYVKKGRKQHSVRLKLLNFEYMLLILVPYNNSK